jgi:hypothetical protein
MPVSVASGERSFYNLKLIKFYLKLPMSQERSSSLATVSTENIIAQIFDFSVLIKISATDNPT